MSSLNKVPISKFFSYVPVIILFLSVLNEFDSNFLKFEYFFFNFIHMLIFFWTLKNPNQLGYVSIFTAGIINDVIIGMPIGISSYCYFLICVATAYIRNITLSPNFINDWLSLLFVISFINSIQVLILDLIFLIEISYISYLINTVFTFLLYPLFFLIFNYINQKIIPRTND